MHIEVGREFKSLSEYPLVSINNRIYPTIIAAITNKIFACEIFIKVILMMELNEFTKGHTISQLLNKTKVKEDLKKKLIKYNFEEEILKIDSAFQDWRYSYEHDQLVINTAFVNDLCSLLEEKCRTQIYEVYKLNMLESFI